jgi:hypothetical protein
MNKTLVFAATAVALLAVAGGNSAWAQGVESDVVVITVPGTAPFTLALPEAAGVSQFAPAFFPAPAGAPDQLLNFYQDSTLSILSDQLYIQAGSWYFASDPDLQNLTIPIVGKIAETGQFQDVSSFFLDANGAPLPHGFIVVASDLNGIPEPSSILLMTGGVVSLLIVARRRSIRSRRLAAL